MKKKVPAGTEKKFERLADASLSNCSIGADAPAATFGKTAFADFTSVRYKLESSADAGEISLRPHHGLCLLNFRGKGYSDDFSRNMTAMQELLLRHPETRIRIAEGADDLCARCPNRRGHACSSEHPPLFDANVLRMTGRGAGEVMTWQEFSSATEPLSLYHLDEACPDCEWLSLCHEIAQERIRGEKKG